MQNNPTVITYLSQRGLAAYAGCSAQVVRTRLKTGQLIPIARVQNGIELFSYEQAVELAKEPTAVIF